MNLGPVINVAIGLIMTFAVMALVVSGVREALATLLNSRAKTLRQGIQNLLNDPTMTGLASKVLGHAAINPLATTTPVGGVGSAGPSYIAPPQFARAFADVAKIADQAGKVDLAAAIAEVKDPQLNDVLTSIHKRVGDDLEKFEAELATWFDNAMARVAEAYRRHSQFWAIGLAVILAAFLNVDAIYIARAIWASPELVAQVGNLGDQNSAAFKDLATLASAGFPMGWTPERAKALAQAKAGDMDMLLLMAPGWLVTAAASMLGAPFWFNLLSQLRGSTSTPSQAAPVKP